MSEWQPIETAPKDGTRFIAGVAGTEDVAICSRHDPGGAARNPRHHYECWLVEFSGRHQPTHWMPMPAPPKSVTPA
jgi:hypothetical protein